jgi:hypothetical protein
MRDLASFKDIHKGEVIWVVGSGGTLDFIDPSFFDDQICIAANFVGKIFGLANYFTFSHYHTDSLEMADSSRFVFTPRREHGNRDEWSGFLPNNVVLFDTNAGEPGTRFDPYGRDNPGENLVVGSSSIHGAMHLAAHMGAKAIVLVGVDCGRLNDMDRFSNYPAGDTPWDIYNDHLVMMKRWIGSNYDCQVYSLNPFVNLNLEGNKFRGKSEIN